MYFDRSLLQFDPVITKLTKWHPDSGLNLYRVFESLFFLKISLNLTPPISIGLALIGFFHLRLKMEGIDWGKIVNE